MSNGNGTTGNTNGSTDSDDKTLDIRVINNGVKLLGEAVVPGASLLLEKQIGAGLLAGGLGVLGGAALGSTFGPLGYILTRYGASALSFSQSLKDPPVIDTNKKELQDVGRAVRENTSVLREMGRAAGAGGVPPAFAPAMGHGPAMSAASQPIAGVVDIADALNLLQQVNDRLVRMDARLSNVEQSIADVQPAARRGRRRPS